MPLNKKQPTIYGMNTAALVSLALVPREEYDAMDVQEVTPSVVNAGDGTQISIPPVLLVGTVEQTRQEAHKMIDTIWDAHEERIAEDAAD